MSDFTILKVGGQREWTTPDGERTFVYYDVEFEGNQGRGTASLKRLKSSPPPVEGEIVDATIEHKGDKVELKPIRKGSGGRPQGKSPQESAEIRRMHSQEMALRLVEIELQRGVLSESEAKTTELLEKRADWFDEDAKRAGERA